MVQVTVEFETIEQAAQFLAHNEVQQMITIHSDAPAPKRGRPLKQNAVAAVQAETPAPQTASAVAATAPIGAAPVVATPAPVAAAPKAANQPVQGIPTSHDVVRTALREVFNTKGATVATAILSQFKAARVSDVKPEQFADFIKACQA